MAAGASRGVRLRSSESIELRRDPAQLAKPGTAYTWDCSADHEVEFDVHENGNRLPEQRAGLEAPAPGGLDSFLIETEGTVERSHNTRLTTGPVAIDDALHEHRALDVRLHCRRRVLRLLNHQRDRRRDAPLAWIVDAVAGVAASAATEFRTVAVAGARAVADSS